MACTIKYDFSFVTREFISSPFLTPICGESEGVDCRIEKSIQTGHEQS